MSVCLFVPTPPRERLDLMVKKITASLVLAFIAVVYSITVAPAASASGGPGIVIDSAYSTPEQSLSFVLNVGEPVCLETVGTWEARIGVQNNSPVDISASIVEGKGAKLEPGQAGGFFTRGIGETKAITLGYSFGDNPAEEYSFEITASDCLDHEDLSPQAIDCTLLNVTLPQVANEDHSYDVGDEIDYELLVKGGLPEGISPHVAITYEGGKGGFTNLNPETLTFTFVPENSGAYVFEAVFLDEAGNPLSVVDPSMCTATLTVSDDIMAPPTSNPVQPEPPKAPTVQPVKATPQPQAATLPVTGPINTFVLSLVGFGLLGIGTALNRKFSS